MVYVYGILKFSLIVFLTFLKEKNLKIIILKNILKY